MAQVKKEEVRNAILDSAAALFREQGYHAATLRAVATRAEVSLANIYAYFASKLDILFALYTPWFEARLTQLEKRAIKTADPRRRLRFVVRSLWCDMPVEADGMHVILMQALSSARPDDYDPRLIFWAEEKLATLLRTCLPERGLTPHAWRAIAHIMIMTLDGFTISSRLHAKGACTTATIDAVCRLVWPADAGSETPGPISGGLRPKTFPASRRRQIP